jgi:phosphoserine phosphatase
MGKAKHVDVWLVRAGCTPWEEEGRVVGATDLPSCAAGIRSAHEAAAALAHEPISAVISAPCESARTTAGMIAEAVDAKSRSIDGLEEINLGLWEGNLACDLEGRCPRSFKQWKQDPASVTPPEGEAYDEASARIIEAFERAIQKHVKSGHGLVFVLGPSVLGIVKCRLLGRPASEMWGLVEEEAAHVQRICVDLVTMSSMNPAGSLVQARR